ncbi:Hok/Gef family protein [Serratia quinivorans]|uniref:Hok/Gef family protein n=1 Tax=Serratia quinivorans TaxID=137545 RepID=UPI003F9B5B7A
MQQERVVLRLMIICTTLIALMWITRGSLCELRIKLGDTEVAAILAYEPER